MGEHSRELASLLMKINVYQPTSSMVDHMQKSSKILTMDLQKTGRLK